jgi:predicted enzyme related to lactoylglutathione lyase
MAENGFVWFELMTPDVKSALDFYGRVLGWTAAKFPGEGEYMIVSANGKAVGGVMSMPPGLPHPFWLGYIGVSDIDAASARFKRAGGAQHRAWDLPEVGRLALLSDPQGAPIAMIQGAGQQPSEAFSQQQPGHGNWTELHATDPDAAVAFYTDQFGWVKDVEMDMGPMGTYRIFRHGDAQIGGIMRAGEGMRPAWLYYFGVPDVNAAVTDISAVGGSVLRGPTEVPGGAKIVQARDPHGAMFAVVGPG